MLRTKPMKRTGRLAAVGRRKWSARAAEKRLDKLWAEAIKLRDGKCIRCGTTRNLQAAHIHSRSKKSVRHDLLNGVTACGGCHLFQFHKHPIEFAEMIRKRLGDDLYTLLLVRASKPAAPMNQFVAELKEHELRTAIEGFKRASTP